MIQITPLFENVFKLLNFRSVLFLIPLKMLVPSPRATGSIIILYSSIKTASVRLLTTFPLPRIVMSLPLVDLSSRIFRTVSPLIIVVLFHSDYFSEFERTIFSDEFILSATTGKCSCAGSDGQKLYISS